MSIAQQFRDKYDVALGAADETVGKGADYRRTMLMQALDAADLMLVEKDYIQSLFDALAKAPPANLNRVEEEEGK